MLMFNTPDSVTITILRKAATNWRGDPVGEEFEESHEIDNVRIDWGGMSTDGFLKDQAEIRGTLLMPIGSDVVATDRIELPTGDRVRVRGKPFEYKNGMVSGKMLRFMGVD